MNQKHLIFLMGGMLIAVAALAGCAEPEEAEGPVEDDVVIDENNGVNDTADGEPDIGPAEEPGAEGDETPIVDDPQYPPGA